MAYGKMNFAAVDVHLVDRAAEPGQVVVACVGVHLDAGDGCVQADSDQRESQKYAVEGGLSVVGRVGLALS